MKKYLAIGLCLVSMGGWAETTFKNWKALGYKSANDQMHLYEIGTIEWELMAEKIGESKYIEKLKNCINKNPFCSAILGKYYYEHKNYSRAYQLLSTYYVDLNKYSFDPYRGNVEFELGAMFDNGFGVLQNEDKAIAHYKICASVGNKSCAYNISIIYGHRISESNDYKIQTSNIIKSYAWRQVSRALGQEKAYLKAGGTENISVALDMKVEDANKLNLRPQANKLASQICSTIPKCIQ